jgi:hypothetical protein
MLSYPAVLLLLSAAGLNVELVVARALDHRMLGVIALRLVEDGHVVLPPASGGQVRISLIGAQGGTSLSVEHSDHSHESWLISDDSVSLMRLELAQRALLAIQHDLGDDAPEKLAGSGVAIDVTTSASVAAHLVQESLASSILSSGFALWPTQQSGVSTLCVAVDAWRVEVSIGHPDCTDTTSETIGRDEGEPLELFHERWISRALELLREVPLVESHPQRILVPVEVSSPVRPLEETPRAVATSAGLGVIARAGGTDPMLALSARLAHTTGFCPQLRLTLVPSTVRQLTVFEIGATIGPGAAIALLSDVFVEGSLLAGMSLHAFRVAEADSGVRADWQILVPVSVRWAVDDNFGIEGTMTAGVSGTDREHRIGDEIVWHRGVFSAGVVFSATYRFSR